MFKQKQRLPWQQLGLDYTANKPKDIGSEEKVILNCLVMRIVGTFPQIMGVRVNPGD